LVDPTSLFDVQVKRIHEYKRQHLNALGVIARYLRIKNGETQGLAPRTVIFGGKAAPGYAMAKLIIRFINGIAEVVNSDPEMKGLLKVVFLADFNVQLGEKIYPAADLSEQISTAGLEASGTGNMKFALNGALTIGTLDGANVEILEEVGQDNIFIFGLTVEGVTDLYARGYNPWDFYWASEDLRLSLDWLASDYFTGNQDEFKPLRDSLLTHGDPFLVMADYEAYAASQAEVDKAYRDQPRWQKMAIHNTARVGKFSSDRTILEYAEKVWKLPQVGV
jgi:starch phosphorylase